MQDKPPGGDYKNGVESRELEQFLRDFDRVATRVEDGDARQVWQFDFAGRAYRLHFYPRGRGSRLRVNPALLEFTSLQTLQKARIPSPHAVAQLNGFRIRGQLGDAIILDDIARAAPLDEFLARQPEIHPNRRRTIVAQVIEILKGIGQQKMGHRQLTLASFLIADDRVYFNDAAGLMSGGMRTLDLLTLAHNASAVATRSELLRAWNALSAGEPPPTFFKLSRKIARHFVARSKGENEGFGRLRIGRWSGHFVKRTPYGVSWSIASHLHIPRRDWETVWPTLLAQIESGQFDTIKSDRSGEVLTGQIILAGRPISVFLKRPRRKFWFRYILDLFRPARAMRNWHKAWMATCLNLPCEFPLLVMERKVLGYAIDGIIIFEHVPGQQLDRIDLTQLSHADRERLFRRLGRIQRRIEQAGMAHYDSKSTNWIIHMDPHQGPLPVMIDVDGIRMLNNELRSWGIRRLLRAMRQHTQYTPEDSLALCQGYAPYAAVVGETALA